MKERIIAICILLILWVVGTIGIVYSSGYSNFDIIRIWLMSIGGYGVISATFLNIWNAWDTSKNISERLQFDRVNNSFEYIYRFDSPSLKDARDLTRKERKLKDDLSNNELLEKINSKEDLERSIITVFNFWEEIYHAIESKRVDEEVLKKFFAEIYCNMYRRFEIWLNYRNEKGINIVGRKALDKLYRKWS